MNSLIEIPMVQCIGKMSSIKKNGIILDSIAVYGLVNGGVKDGKVDYQLHVVNDNIVIYPMGNYNEYILKATRVVPVENISVIINDKESYSRW